MLLIILCNMDWRIRVVKKNKPKHCIEPQSHSLVIMIQRSISRRWKVHPCYCHELKGSPPVIVMSLKSISPLFSVNNEKVFDSFF